MRSRWLSPFANCMSQRTMHLGDVEDVLVCGTQSHQQNNRNYLKTMFPRSKSAVIGLNE
jgi:hypothetical protein